MGLRRKRRPRETGHLEPIMEAEDFIAALGRTDWRISEVYRMHYDVAQQFYRSDEWKAVRNEVVESQPLVCKGCGLDMHDDRKMINVDHILPLRFFWFLRLTLSNLQILCRDCNECKGNRVYQDITLVAKERARLKQNPPKSRISDEISLIAATWKREYDALPLDLSRTFEMYVEQKLEEIFNEMKPHHMNALFMQAADLFLRRDTKLYARIKTAWNLKKKANRETN